MGITLLQGAVKDGFYPLQRCHSTGSFPGSSQVLVNIKGSIKLWHSRLRHHSSAILQIVVSSNKLAILGTTYVDIFPSKCAIAKNHKLPFGSSTTTTSHSLELLHCDL